MHNDELDETAMYGLGGRVPLLNPGELDEAQARVYQRLSASRVGAAAASGFQAQLTDGRFIGPFNAYLYAPPIANALMDWAAAIASFGLPADACQVAILQVGVAWGSDYEIYAHVAEARHFGIPGDAITAILEGRKPTGLRPAAAVALRLSHALSVSHTVTGDIYDEAVAQFGVAGLVALVNLIGRYMNTAAMLACFRVPAPVEDSL
jgi:4-carboxymuconolactone decarboxylase